MQTPTTHHNRFTVLFPGTPGWASARRELLDLMVQGKINRGRHTDHLARRHSNRTIQCPPPPSPTIFYRPNALPATQPTASKHCECKEWYKKQAGDDECTQSIECSLSMWCHVHILHPLIQLHAMDSYNMVSIAHAISCRTQITSIETATSLASNSPATCTSEVNVDKQQTWIDNSSILLQKRLDTERYCTVLGRLIRQQHQVTNLHWEKVSQLINILNKEWPKKLAAFNESQT